MRGSFGLLWQCVTLPALLVGQVLVAGCPSDEPGSEPADAGADAPDVVVDVTMDAADVEDVSLPDVEDVEDEGLVPDDGAIEVEDDGVVPPDDGDPGDPGPPPDDGAPPPPETCEDLDPVKYAGCDLAPKEVVCAFCPLRNQPAAGLCQKAAAPAEESSCTSIAKKLVDGGVIKAPLVGGLPVYPDCLEPACGDDGKCTLVPIAGCCQSVADCAHLPKGELCFSTTCSEPDPDPPPHLAANPPRYCILETIESCCADTPNAVLLDESFTSYPALPSGWSQLDNQPADLVAWRELKGNKDVCRSGGHCIHIGRPAKTPETEDEDVKECMSYFPGPMSATCKLLTPPAAACTTDTAAVDCAPGMVCQENTAEGGFQCKPGPVQLVLRSPQVDLTKGIPWSLLFMLRMKTEPPTDVTGDNLTAWVMAGGEGTKVFDSASIGNDTHGKGYAKSYHLVTVNLSPWAGKTISLELRFDTKDGQSNYNAGDDPASPAYEGVFVDDLLIRSGCEVVACSTAESCKSQCCMESLCAVPLPQTPFGGEDVKGFCHSLPMEGCETCATNDDCDSPPPGEYDSIQCVKASAAATCGVCEYKSTKCDPATDEVVIASVSFDEGKSLDSLGWETLGDGYCGNTWMVTGWRAKDGAGSLYFGRKDPPACGAGAEAVCGPVGGSEPVCPTFECELLGADTVASVETPPYAIPAIPSGFVLVTFDVLLSTEWDDYPGADEWCGPGTFFDPCPDVLTLTAHQGGKATKLWDSLQSDGSTLCGFSPVTVKLPAALAGKTVTFELTFDSVDSNSNDGEGVYVDNFTIRTDCGGGCTTENVEKECPVKNACETAICVDGECVFESIEGVCCGQADCDDGNACTIDTCKIASGASTGSCAHAIGSDGGCCAAGAVYWAEDLDGDALPSGWVVEDDGSPVKWQWLGDAGKGGTGGLYFGDPAKMTYENGVSAASGAITTPAFEVPPGGDPYLRFHLMLSTELDGFDAAAFDSYLSTIAVFALDRLRVRGTTNGGTSYTDVWRSDDGKPLKGTTIDPDGKVAWVEMGFSLKAFAGQKTLQLRFEFDTFGGEANGFEGVRIDDLVLTQACSSKPCYATAWCEDGDPCTINTCVGSVCKKEDAVGKDGCCFPSPLPEFQHHFDTDTGGWKLDATDSVQWHLTTADASKGSGSLRFAHPTNGDYSSCMCGSPDACEGTCPPEQCKTESGKSAPAGTATSPAFPVTKGKDYIISFDLKADLEVSEGSMGFVESFRVILTYEGADVGVQELATLLCHAGSCDVLDDPCASGVNFVYPGCGDDAAGDYGKWKSVDVTLSDILCKAQQTSGVAETFVATLKGGASPEIRVRVEFSTIDNLANCGSGLYIDEVTISEQCTGWDATCE